MKIRKHEKQILLNTKYINQAQFPLLILLYICQGCILNDVSFMVSLNTAAVARYSTECRPFAL